MRFRVCVFGVVWGAGVLFAQLPGTDPTGSHATIDRLGREIIRGDIAPVRDYLAAGGDANARNARGATLLHYAASADRLDLAEMLLDHRADVNARVMAPGDILGAGSTALDYAAANGYATLAKLLINRGANVYAAYASGRTVLHVAATNGRTEIVRLLLQRGADPNARDEDGSAPIDEAAWRGFHDIVALLLDAGARIDSPQTKTGATPLNEAAFKGQTKVVELLLARHANASLADNSGFAPLENAVRLGYADAVRVLLGNGSAGPRLLELAVLKGQAGVVDLLVSRGADVNARFESGSSPLGDAALKGRNEVVTLLIEKGARVNGRDGHGATPLQDAALNGQQETVRLLLARGAEINARETETGSTALYEAAAFGRSGVVGVLLDAGADPNICNKDGISPLRAALENGNGEAAYRLRAAGGVEACGR